MVVMCKFILTLSWKNEDTAKTERTENEQITYQLYSNKYCNNDTLLEDFVQHLNDEVCCDSNRGSTARNNEASAKLTTANGGTFT